MADFDRPHDPNNPDDSLYQWGDETGLQVETRRIDDFRRIRDLSEVTDPALSEKFRDLLNEAVESLERRREACLSSREELEFAARMEIAERRSRLKVEQAVDEDGSVVTNYKDGHAELGIQQGWTVQANKTASAILEKEIFETAKRPYSCAGRGKRAENDKVEQLCYGVVDELLRQGDFRRRGRGLTELMPRHGTAVLRYEMGRTTNFRRERNPETGVMEFRETDPEWMPRFTVWPLADVLVSHPDCPQAPDQESIFWLKTRVRLDELEDDEKVDVGGIQMGKFKNLEQVRRMVGAWQDSQGVDGAANSSFFPTATLAEYEGPLPMLAWVRAKKIDWRMMQFFGVEVGMDPNPADAEEMEEYGRRLTRIRCWRVAYLTDLESGVQEPESGRVVLQFEPMPQREPRNSLYRFPFKQDGLNFYGYSVTDLGRRLEDAADCLRNADLWIAYFNAHPPKVIDASTLVEATVEEAERMASAPDAVIQGKPGADTSRVVTFLRLPEIGNVEERIQALKREFEFTTGVSAAAKGSDQAPGTGTLGEIQINEMKSQLEMQIIVLDAGREFCRLFGDLLEDAVSFMGEEGFVKFAMKVTGMAESDIRRILPSIDGLANEVDFKHPLVAGVDRTVLVQQMMALFQMTAGAAFGDPQRFATDVLELMGFSRAEELTHTEPGMAPEDEMGQMEQGNWVEPLMQEDQAVHLQAHLAKAQEITDLSMRGVPLTAEGRNLAGLLPQHVQITQGMLSIKQALMMQSQEVEEAGGGGSSPSKPRSEQKIRSDETAPARRAARAPSGGQA